MKKIFKAVTIGLLSACPVLWAGDSVPLYMNEHEPVERRVKDLLSRMTLHEKVMQLQNRQIGEPSAFDDNFGGFSVGTVHDMDHPASQCRTLTDTLSGYCLLYTSPSPRD